MPDVPETFRPRPYQTEAIQALTAGWAGPNNRLAVVLPTGAGKTVVFCNLIRQHLERLNGRRALVIAHREELIEQAAAKLRAVDPALRVGIVKAGRDEHHDVDVIVASIQTLAVDRRREAIRDIGMVIVDECHHAAAPTYMTVLEHFGAWRGVPVAGFTATMTRTDGGLAEVWQDVVHTLDILDMISDGYLCDVRGKRVTIDTLDLDQVKTRNGDLQEGQLGQALDDSGAIQVIADAYREHAPDRPGVAFTPTVATAHSMADALNAKGVKAAAVWGDMPREDRSATLKKYEAGDLQVLTNCMVLTEGFDAPWTSCVVIARPTKSPGLYVQMAGRGLRPSPGKRDALILDVAGASTRHKLASMVDLTERKVGIPEEDETLAEAVAREEETERVRSIASRIEWEEINLFGESAFRWLRTTAGTWFIPLGGDSFMYLARDPGARTYRVRRWTQATGVQVPGGDRPQPLGEAMAWAERQARQIAPGLVSRAASWRNGPPSGKQLAFCRYQSIPVPAGSTKGDVSDLQAAHKVSLILAALHISAAA
ncbi:DEAD/DEAH box helicase [Streptomyces sp. NPDC091292]|uniref:DEAD/DEAH box helicase n=1 Tax=Streptomyces sp. NPDC091292 TaxID=3365991 RepID=UPI0038016BB1